MWHPPGHTGPHMPNYQMVLTEVLTGKVVSLSIVGLHQQSTPSLVLHPSRIPEKAGISQKGVNQK